MNGRKNILGSEEHFLVKLFAGTHTSELDFDIGSDFQSRQTNEIGGDVDDPDLLAHVEDEHFSTSSKSTRLKHQLNGFRDGHEVTAHFRMRDGHRATGANLTKEGRNNRAPAPKNVAESHRHEVAMVLRGRVLNDLLGYPLGGSHHRRRTHCLVGGDENEMLDVGFDCGIHNIASALDVVRHCFEHVVFHERHVLVRGGVEYGVRAIELENLRHPRAVANVRDDRHDLHIREAEEKLLIDVEDGVFAVSEKDEASWSQPRELAA